MRWLAAINPLSYGVDALRQVLLSRQVSGPALSQVSLHPVAADALFLMFFSAIVVFLAALAFYRRN
ncbi:MAG: hypothetical protein ACPLRX_10410 [Candidatus Saccharicenans sp.]